MKKKTIGYMVHKGHSNALKNNLHKEFDQMIMEKDRIFKSELSHIKAQIKREVNLLNIKHKRCKPIEIYFTDYGNKSDSIAIYSGTGVHASIISIKEWEL